ncbi:MAG: hypothetical protein J6A83_05060 [Clostridia bacterium]|nr:hypothetical protein [Clostridia bacterium]
MALLRFKVAPKKNPQTGEFAYHAVKDNYTTISDLKLLERIAANTAVPSGVIRAAVDAIFDTIMNFVLNGHSVQFGDFMNLRPALRCKLIDQGLDPNLPRINNVRSYGQLGSSNLRVMIRVTWRPPVRVLQKPENYDFRRVDV